MATMSAYSRLRQWCAHYKTNQRASFKPDEKAQLHQELYRAIKERAIFQITDFASFAGWGMDKWASEADQESFYAAAVEKEHETACLSFEQYKKRPPVCLRGQRMYVGRVFDWLGQSLECQSFDREKEAIIARPTGDENKSSGKISLSWETVRVAAPEVKGPAACLENIVYLVNGKNGFRVTASQPDKLRIFPDRGTWGWENHFGLIGQPRPDIGPMIEIIGAFDRTNPAHLTTMVRTVEKITVLKKDCDQTQELT